MSHPTAARDGLHLTDVGNAQRFVNLAGGEVRYVHRWGRWIVYKHGRWVVDAGDALVTEKAKRVARALMAMVPQLDDPARGQVYNAARRAESVGAVAAMIKLARGIPDVLVDHEDLDADPDILNVANGTVDLDTGKLRPHDPADLCTLQCPIQFDPKSAAPLWESCLRRWHPDPELREYVQREAGAAATGRPTESLSIHIGIGANGKSKFWNAVQRCLGPYAVVPHRSLLVATRYEQHPTEVASLFRARLAVASETAAAAHLNDEMVKALTGGDRLAARRMREDPWHFLPSHTMVVFSNHKPAVLGTDEGMWRRLRLVEWDVVIPEDERDEMLATKLAEEAPGILRWIVEGAARYLNEGFEPPERVKAASAEYRIQQDTVGRFLAEMVAFVPGAQVATPDLVRAHEIWCADGGIDRDDVTGHWKRVASAMIERSATPGRTRNGRFWRGVSLVQGGHDEAAESTERDACDTFSSYRPREAISRGNRNTRHTRHTAAQEAEDVDRLVTAFPGTVVEEAVSA